MKKTFLLIVAVVLSPALARAETPVAAKPLPKAAATVVPFELLPSGHMTVMVKVTARGRTS